MANTVIAIKKSGTPSAIPTSLANGELAINYADGKLYYKAANGTIQAIAGVESNYFGTVNVGGTLVVADTPNDILTLVAGSNITLTPDAINDRITISASITSNGGNGGASVTTSDTAPLAPGNGDLWWNTNQLKMFIYYDDGTSAQWIETAPSYIYTLSDIIAAAAFDAANASFTKANNAIANTAGITTAGDFNVPGEIFLESLAFDQTANVVVSANGQLAWNFDEQTLDLMVDSTGSGTVLQIGQEIYYRVKNQTGSTITNGTVVMAAGTLGASGRLLITPAIANGTYPSKYVMGIATQDIPNGGDGFVTAFGKIRGLNTSLFNEGDILYADPAAPGGLTSTMPTAPNTKTTVAICIHKNTTSGVLFVRPTFGSKLNEDELVELGTLANNDVLVYISANNRFENRPQDALFPYLTAAEAFNQANVAYTTANNYIPAFDKANSANLLAYNTGIGANAFAVETFSAANNTPVGNTLGNSYYALRSTRRSLNFLSGSNITINVDDDSAGNRANITITSTASGSSIPLTNDAVNATRYILFANNLTGNLVTANVDAGLSFNPSSNTLTINGPLNAVTKSFVINHPTKDGMTLRYGSLEGPENGVYARGRVQGYYIYLPDYWEKLVDEHSITVSLTAIGKTNMPSVLSWDNKKVVLHSETPIDCFYYIIGERKDVEKLVVEY